MVAKSGGYFEPLFQEYHGVTQGNPLYPTVFNVVLDAVIRKWVMVVAMTEEGTEGIGEKIQDLEAFFYAYYRLVASPWTERL